MILISCIEEGKVCFEDDVYTLRCTLLHLHRSVRHCCIVLDDRRGLHCVTVLFICYIREGEGGRGKGGQEVHRFGFGLFCELVLSNIAERVRVRERALFFLLLEVEQEQNRFPLPLYIWLE